MHNSAFYEHALLARLMGVHLVEGRDLVCHGTDVFLRTTEGEVPVHVIYRRIDDDYLDPLQFRPESLVGCPGVVNAARAGRVTIANGVGNGVADDKLVYAYVPEMIRYYLARIRSCATSRPCTSRTTVRADALRPAGRAGVQEGGRLGGKGLVIGPAARGRAGRAGAGRRGRPPALDRPAGGRALHLAHLGRRRHGADATWTCGPFAVNDGENVWVLPGGLTRVALQEGGLVVNSSQGGGSKDTWVVGGGPAGARAAAPPGRPRSAPGHPWTPARGGDSEQRAATATDNSDRTATAAST